MYNKTETSTPEKSYAGSAFVRFLQKIAKPKSIIKKPYVYVPPCPACGDRMTGSYFVANDISTVNWIVEEALRNGELAKPRADEEGENIAFCCNCGFEWEYKRDTRWLTLEEIEREKQARCTVELLAQRMESKTSQPGKPGGVAKAVSETLIDPIKGIMQRAGKIKTEDASEASDEAESDR